MVTLLKNKKLMIKIDVLIQEKKWKKRDPIKRLEDSIILRGVTRKEIKGLKNNSDC